MLGWLRPWGYVDDEASAGSGDVHLLQRLVCEAILSGEAGLDVVSIVAAESSPAVYSAVPLYAGEARLHGHGAAFYSCRLSANSVRAWG